MVESSDKFELKIARHKLASTNGFWNNMKLNSPWIFGMVTAIIQQRSFATKEEWRDYYFQTGKERLKLIESVTPEEKQALQSIEISKYYTCSYEVNQINTMYGRTKEELDNIGDILYGAVRAAGNPHGITRHECRYMVVYRLLAETWHGLMLREKHTITTLRNVFGTDYRIEKVDGETDTKYEVDAEVFFKDKLVAGLQIKPESYKTNFKDNHKAYQINKYKNDAYTKLKEVPVIYIYSDMKGKIHNFEDLRQITELAKQKELV